MSQISRNLDIRPKDDSRIKLEEGYRIHPFLHLAEQKVFANFKHIFPEIIRRVLNLSFCLSSLFIHYLNIQVDTFYDFVNFFNEFEPIKIAIFKYVVFY